MGFYIASDFWICFAPERIGFAQLSSLSMTQEEFQSSAHYFFGSLQNFIGKSKFLNQEGQPTGQVNSKRGVLLSVSVFMAHKPTLWDREVWLCQCLFFRVILSNSLLLSRKMPLRRDKEGGYPCAHGVSEWRTFGKMWF